MKAVNYLVAQYKFFYLRSTNASCFNLIKGIKFVSLLCNYVKYLTIQAVLSPVVKLGIYL